MSYELKKVLIYITVVLICFGGFVLLSREKKEPNSGKVTFEQSEPKEEFSNSEKVFAPGEHVLSVPFYKNPTKTRLQYPYYEGYSAIGLSTSAWGEYGEMFEGGSILYVNNVEVVCEAATTDSHGNLVYSEFGLPTWPVQKPDLNITSETKDFEVGEHIISVPVSVEPIESNVQYSFGSSDCYEVVDISTTSYGRWGYKFGGTCVLYVNTAPVRCTATSKDEAGNIAYCNFGTPLTEVIARELK